jgi:hypothetical protein
MARIIEFEGENFKRLRFVRVERMGPVTVIGGDNGEGKSSTLDIIDATLYGAKNSPEDPIHGGAKSARTMVKLTDPDLIAECSWTASGGRKLEVRAKPGTKPLPEPQALLDKVVGKRFDPGEFVRLRPSEQLALLSRVTGLDFSALDDKRKAIYEQRTSDNRDLDKATARLGSLPEVADAPDQEESLSSLLSEIDKAEEAKRANAEKRAAVERARAEHKATKTRIDELKVEISELEKTLADLAASGKALAAEAKALKDPDVAALRERAKTLEATNTRVRAKHERAAVEIEQARLKSVVEAHTAAIAEIDAEKQKLLAEARMPVPGLGFGDGCVLFGGHPLKQAATSEQIRTATAIWIALNPGLKTMAIYNASLLDEKSAQALKDTAAAAGVDLLLEVVGKDGATLVIEDGQVVGAEPRAKSKKVAAPPAEVAPSAPVDAGDEWAAETTAAPEPPPKPAAPAPAPAKTTAAPSDVDCPF